MTNDGNILPAGQFEQLSSFFSTGQEVLPRPITRLKSQVHSSYVACVFCPTFIREWSSKGIRIYNSNSLRGRQNRASVNEWEQWGKIPMNNARSFTLLFLSLLWGHYQDFVLCCCRVRRPLLPSLSPTVTLSVKNSSRSSSRLLTEIQSKCVLSWGLLVPCLSFILLWNFYYLKPYSIWRWLKIILIS